jgi:hypothetical protein
MIVPLLLAALTAAAPAPSPSPQPFLKTIVTVKVSTFCNAVRSLGIPLAYASERNDEAFDAINRSMLKFMADNVGKGAVTKAEYENMDNGYDDSDVYNAANTLSVSSISQVAYQIQQNLALEDDFMNKSWAKVPKGTDREVDAMRQRLQNMIDLQRALVNQYTSIVELYRDNQGNAALHGDQNSVQGDAAEKMNAAGAGNPDQYKAILRQVILGQTAAIADAKRIGAGLASAPLPDASKVAHSGNTAGVVQQLRLQEMAFKPEIFKAGDACGL